MIFKPSPIVIIIIALSAFSIGSLTGYKFEHSKTVAVKNEYALFLADVTAKGELAASRAASQTKEYERIKNDQDELYQARIATLNADIKRLRYKTSTNSSYLPKVGGTASSTNRICFDRNKLDQSIREFDTAIQGIVEQGDNNGIGLNIAREWVKSLQ